MHNYQKKRVVTVIKKKKKKTTEEKARSVINVLLSGVLSGQARALARHSGRATHQNTSGEKRYADMTTADDGGEISGGETFPLQPLFLLLARWLLLGPRLDAAMRILGNGALRSVSHLKTRWQEASHPSAPLTRSCGFPPRIRFTLYGFLQHSLHSVRACPF